MHIQGAWGLLINRTGTECDDPEPVQGVGEVSDDLRGEAPDLLKVAAANAPARVDDEDQVDCLVAL